MLMLATAFIVAFNFTFINVKADNSGSSGGGGVGDSDVQYTDDELKAVIAQHTNFSLTLDGKKDYFSYNSNSWYCNSFRCGDDTAVFNFIKTFYKSSNPLIFITRCYGDLCNIVASKVGYVSRNTYSDVNEIISDLGVDYVNQHFTVDTDGNVGIDSIALNKIRDMLESAYLTNNGMYVLRGNEAAFNSKISSIASYLEYPEDVSAFYAEAETWDIITEYNYANITSYIEIPSNVFYFYGDYARFVSNVSSTPYTLFFADKEGDSIRYFDYMHYYRAGGGYNTGYDEQKVSKFISVGNSFTQFQFFWMDENFKRLSMYQNCYFYSRKDMYIFWSYQKLYDYLHGDGSYLATKFHEEQKELLITANQLTEDTNAKLEGIYNAIKEGSNNVTTSDELQKLIDDTINSIDKVVDNTEETNNKLDKLIDYVKKQNDILLDLLDVTKSIDKSVNNIEAISTAEMLKNIFTDFKSCTDKMKTAFPFSLPYDIYALFNVLAAEPEAPKFTVDFNGLIQKALNTDKYYDNLVLTIDFSVMEPVSSVSRGFLSLTFIGYIISLSRKMFFNIGGGSSG